MDVLFQWFRLCGRDKGGLSNCHLDPFGIVIPSTHFKSIIVNSPNHHAKECAND